MDYVRKGTLWVSFTEERIYKLCFEDRKDFARKENERGHFKKKDKYVQRFIVRSSNAEIR